MRGRKVSNALDTINEMDLSVYRESNGIFNKVLFVITLFLCSFYPLAQPNVSI